MKHNHLTFLFTALLVLAAVILAWRMRTSTHSPDTNNLLNRGGDRLDDVTEFLPSTDNLLNQDGDRFDYFNKPSPETNLEEWSTPGGTTDDDPLIEFDLSYLAKWSDYILPIGIRFRPMYLYMANNNNHWDSENVTFTKATMKRVNLEIVELLLKNKNTIYVEIMLEMAQNDKNLEPRVADVLWNAAQDGNVEIAQLFTDADMDGLQNEHGDTALFKAVVQNHTTAIKTLLAAGVDVHVKDAHGSTALILAVANDDVEMVEKFIAAGSDIHHENDFGNTAFLETVEMNKNNSMEILTLLLAAGADDNTMYLGGWHELMLAVRSMNVEAIQQLFLAGVDVNVRSPRGTPLFHKAIETKNIEIVKLFLSEGVDINARDGNGFTALHHAVHTKDADIVTVLVAAGKKNAQFQQEAVDVFKEDFRSLTDDILKIFDDAGISRYWD
jgi:ankyrin repeat protein